GPRHLHRNHWPATVPARARCSRSSRGSPSPRRGAPTQAGDLGSAVHLERHYVNGRCLLDTRAPPMTGLAVRRAIRESRLLGWVVPYTRTPRAQLRQISRDLRLAYLKRRYGTIASREFIRDLRTAVEAGAGYATGKIGVSNHFWMSYEILLRQGLDPRELRQFEEDLMFHGLKQSGLFPADPVFYLRFNTFYMQHVRNLDCLGICLSPREFEIKRYYKVDGNGIFDIAQRPPNTGQRRAGKAPHSDQRECYLPLFRGKNILIICPFASVLSKRATKEIFEGVW